jgi:hypothetical protein
VEDFGFSNILILNKLLETTGAPTDQSAAISDLE